MLRVVSVVDNGTSSPDPQMCHMASHGHVRIESCKIENEISRNVRLVRSETYRSDWNMHLPSHIQRFESTLMPYFVSHVSYGTHADLQRRNISTTRVFTLASMKYLIYTTHLSTPHITES